MQSDPNLNKKRDRSGSISSDSGSKKQKVSSFLESVENLKGNEIVELILALDDSKDYQSIFEIIKQFMDNLQESIKPNPNYYIALIYIAKVRPSIYKQDQNLFFYLASCLLPKNRPNKRVSITIAPVLAANLLYSSFVNIEEWPAEFIQAYLEDSLEGREWVDHDSTVLFCNNILTVMPKDRMSDQSNASTDASKPIVTNNSQHEDVRNRYPSAELREIVKENIYNIFLNFFNSPSNQDKTKNIIKLMIVCSSYPDVRLYAAEKLESWLNQNPLAIDAKELFKRVIVNTYSNDEKDLRVVRLLFHIKCRNRTINLQYPESMSELLLQNQNYYKIGLREIPFIYDPSDLRSPLIKIFLTCYDQVGENMREFELAKVFKDMANDPKFSKSLQQRIRTIVKIIQQRATINFHLLCSGLMSDYPLIYNRDAQSQIFWICQMKDTICSLIVLSIDPTIYDGSTPLSNIDFNLLNSTFQFIVEIQQEAMTWCQHIIKKCNNNPVSALIPTLKHILFITPYVDRQSPNIVSNLNKILSLIPPSEDIMLQILKMHKADLIMNKDALDIIETLSYRSIYYMKTLNKPNLFTFCDSKFPKALFQACEFNPQANDDHAKDIIKKLGGVLYNSSCFWRAITIMCILTAVCPSTLGRYCWNNIPTIRSIIQIIITQSWNSPSMINKLFHNVDTLKEFDIILEYERKLTGNMSLKIHESQLCNILTIIDLHGTSIKPPDEILDTVFRRSQELELSQHFTKSRDPDFLVEIMKHQEPAESIKWLSSIIQKDSETLAMLPSYFISQLLLVCQSDDPSDISSAPLSEYNKIVNIINTSLSMSSERTKEIIGFFAEKLGDNDKKIRELSKRSLSTLIKGSDESQQYILDDMAFPTKFSWLNSVNHLKFASEAENILINFLVKSIHSETEIDAIKSYMLYIFKQIFHDNTFRNWDIALNLYNEIHILLRESIYCSQIVFSDKLLYWMALTLFINILSHDHDWNDDLIQVEFIGRKNQLKKISKLFIEDIIKFLCINIDQECIDFKDSNQKLKQLCDHLYYYDEVTKSLEVCNLIIDGNEISLLSMLNELDALNLSKIEHHFIWALGLFSLTDTSKLKLLNEYRLPVKCFKSIVEGFNQFLDKPDEFKNHISFNNIDPLTLIDKISYYEKEHADFNYETLKQTILNLYHQEDEEMQVENDEIFEMKSCKYNFNIPSIESMNSDEKAKFVVNEMFISNDEKRIFCVYDDLQNLFFDELLSNSFELTDKVIIYLNEQCQSNIASIIQSIDAFSEYIYPVFCNIQTRISLLFNEEIENNYYSFVTKIIDYVHQNQYDMHMNIVYHLFINDYEKILRREVSNKSTIVKDTIDLKNLSYDDVMWNLVNVEGSLEIEYNDESFISYILGIAKKNSFALETSVDKIIQSLKKVNIQNEKIVSNLIVILESLHEFIEKDKLNFYYGIFVDHMIQLSSEKDYFNLVQFTFKKADSFIKFKPLLTNYLIHETTWNTRRKIMNYILSDEIPIDSLDCLACLNFIEGYLVHPESWKKLTKEELNTPPTLYIFDPKNLTRLSLIILKEMEMFNEPMLSRNLNRFSKLLLSCASQNRDNLLHVIKTLLQKASDEMNIDNDDMELENNKTALVEKLLEKIYLNYPWEVFSFTEKFSEITDLTHDPSRLDMHLHKIVKGLYGDEMSTVSYSLCRKLAVTHPTIVVKYIPTLTSLLNGRQEFQENPKNQLFFLHVLGILDLMRPQIFYTFNIDRMSTLLSPFISFLRECKRQEYRKENVVLVGKIFEFLCYYIIELKKIDSHNESKFLELISLKRKVVEKLEEKYKEISKIVLFLNIIDGQEEPEQSLNEEDIQATREKLKSLSNMVTVLNSNQNLDLLYNMMKEIDIFTSRAPTILLSIIDEIILFMSWSYLTANIISKTQLHITITSKIEQIRGLAFKLSLRYVHNFPKESKKVIESCISCLTSDIEDVVKEAIHYAPEFFLYCQTLNEQIKILIILLKLGKNSEQEFKKIISDTLNLHFMTK